MKVNWEKVKNRREELGMTMEDLGNAIGVQRSAINKYEKGQIKNVSLITLSEIAEALGVTVGWLLDMDGMGMYGLLKDDAKKHAEAKAYEQIEKMSISEQIATILRLWEKLKPEAKKMLLPVLAELTKMEEEK